MSNVPAEAVPYSLRVRYFETDQMQVAHHANYLVWFEASRSEFCRVKGIDYAQMERNSLFLPVVEARCRYKKPAAYDDLITIFVWVLSIKRSVLKLKYVVMNGDNEIAEGETTQMLISKSGRPIQFPSNIAEKFVTDEQIK